MRTVVFVCLHGAAKSRLAAAFFNSVAPTGWRAVSTGLEPQEAVSELARGLAAGTQAEAHFDSAAPRLLSTVTAPDLVVAIDCDVPDAVRWHLANPDGGEPMRDELADLATALAQQTPGATTGSMGSWQRTDST